MDTVCVIKSHVEEVLRQAKQAKARATVDEQRDLDRLISECGVALSKVRRWPSYRGGRLETGDAQKVMNLHEELVKRHKPLFQAAG